MDNTTKRTIGFHPCIGKTAKGEERPTTAVFRTADGKLETYELVEQQLLDLFSCGAVIEWRDRDLTDDVSALPPHHVRREPTTKAAFEAYVPGDASKLDEERATLFEVRTTKRGKRDPKEEIFRLQVPAKTIAIDPANDTVGVANGGLGSQIISVLLGRYPEMDVRMIGSGTLKEHRPEFDALLPKRLRTAATKMRTAAEKKPSDAPPAEDGEPEDDEEEEAPSRSKAKDANAKFDAHRIAVALADAAAAKRFDRCTVRNRDWAKVTLSYRDLEEARKGRVAAVQQFRQICLAAMRQLVADPRVPYVTIDDAGGQSAEELIRSYVAALDLCGFAPKEVERRADVIRQAYSRIEGALAAEERMEGHLEDALGALPEYTQFLAALKEKSHETTGMPLGKYIGERIFGRWIAGFGRPMDARLSEPVRQADADRIAACRDALTRAIAAIDRSGLPPQPATGEGRTREWLDVCESRTGATLEAVKGDGDDVRTQLLETQLEGIRAARTAYRRLMNAHKSSKDRPVNRLIALMGLHVRQGGKYAGTKKENEFPQRRKGMRANWDEHLLRQGAYQWGTLIIKGGDSHWKTHVYGPVKELALANGATKSRAHKKAFWRMVTRAVRWVMEEWFRWERSRGPAIAPAPEAKAA